MNVKSLAILCLSALAVNALACGGGSYSGAQRDLDPASLAANQQVDRLTAIIQVANLVNFAIGSAVSLVPGGGVVYDTAQAMTYFVAGEDKQARDSAIHATIGVLTLPALGAPEVLVKASDVIVKAAAISDMVYDAHNNR